MTARGAAMDVPRAVPLPRQRRGSVAGRAGMAIVAAFAALAALSAFGLAGESWSAMAGSAWEAPSAVHWFGTNRLGQDIFDRAVHSSLTAFSVGLLVAGAATLFGALIGALSGWLARRWFDGAVVWLMGVLDSIPFYLFIAAVAFALQGSPWAMQIGMVATFWTGTARLVRGEVMRLKHREYVSAARAIGLPDVLILLRHVLPNTVHILLIQGTLVFVAAIKTEVILSFLGIGVQDGVSWGVMLAESTQEVLAGHFGNFLAASGFLFLLLLGLNLGSDALQDRFDVRGDTS